MKVTHKKYPRETEVYFGSEREGITLSICRGGVAVSGFYDSMVGLRGGFLTWQEFEDLRDKAHLTHREASK